MSFWMILENSGFFQSISKKQKFLYYPGLHSRVDTQSSRYGTHELFQVKIFEYIYYSILTNMFLEIIIKKIFEKIFIYFF